MSVKETVKRIADEWNPLAIRRRNGMRRELKNAEPSFLCPNCIGGILFHELGLQFRSPTVNLMMKQRDFLRFVLNLDYYLSQPLVFFENPGYACPCAYADDITIHFTHYHSAREAEEKWRERSKRINRENLFIFMSERDGITKEELMQLNAVKARGIIAFTAHDYPDLPYTQYIEKYASNGEIGNILEKNWATGRREYEKYFDFVKWFNEANGAPFDISRFTK